MTITCVSDINTDMDRDNESNTTEAGTPARSAADLILHPVRMRILLALARGEPLTPLGLEQILPDIPHASLYRHVAALADGGLLEVVGERRVRGAVERTYALRSGAAVLGPDDVRNMTRTEHLRYFAMFLAHLLDELGRYVRRERIDPPVDGLAYRAATVYLTDEEHAALLVEILDAVRQRLEVPAGPGRVERTIATISIPGSSAVPAPPSSGIDPAE